MAIGDDAALGGLDLVAATDDKRDGWEEINRTRDYVALPVWTGTLAKAGVTADVAMDITDTSDLWSMSDLTVDAVLIPSTGLWRVSMTLQQTNTMACSAYLYVNSSLFIRLGATGASGAASCPAFSVVLPLTAGDSLEFHASAASSATFTGFASVEKIRPW
jgi:hypothetical protein